MTQMNDFKRQLGRNLREARVAKGLRQSDLSSMVYTTTPAVSNWERGVRAPNVEMLASIVCVLGVSLDDVVPRVELEYKVDENQMKLEV